MGRHAERRRAGAIPERRGHGTQSRLWFNEANDSHYFLVPGLIVLIMTLIGAFLTALVMAREWERGTFEAMFVTPVRVRGDPARQDAPVFRARDDRAVPVHAGGEITCSTSAARLALVLTGVSMLYLLVTLGIGLSVSSVTKSQFVASQIALLVTFMPAMMLSGFLFDLRSMPVAIRLITFFCRRAITWLCCRPIFWPAISGA